MLGSLNFTSPSSRLKSPEHVERGEDGAEPRLDENFPGFASGNQSASILLESSSPLRLTRSFRLIVAARVLLAG
jgi:hypothetical protein